MEIIGSILVVLAFLLILYGLYNAYKLWRDGVKRVDKKTGGIILAGFVLIFVGGSIVPTPEESQPTTATKTEVDEGVEKDVSWDDLTAEEKLEKAAIEVLGDKANTDEPRIVDIIFSEFEDETIATFKLNADENLNGDYTRKSILMDTKDLLEDLSDRGYSGNINVMWLLPLVDQYGNTNNSKVLSLDFKAEELAKVNYDNFNYKNLPDISDDSFVHPALNK